jgi:PAS domain S-box-containing protein
MMQLVLTFVHHGIDGIPTLAFQSLGVAAALLFLGIAVVIHGRFSMESVLFQILTLLSFWWLFAFSWMYGAVNYGEALRWARAAYLAVPLIPAAVYHFTVAVLKIDGPPKKIVRSNWLLCGLLASCSLATDKMIAGLRHYSWGYYPSYGELGVPVIAIFAVLMAWSLWHFWVEYRTRSNTKKLRARWFFIAFAVACTASVDYLPKFGIDVYPFGYLSMLVFAMITAGTIWRYRLVDITPSFAASQILQTMQGAVLVTDLAGNIQLTNHAVEELLGYREAELVDMPISRVADPSRIRFTLERLAKPGVIFDEEMTWRTKEGQTVEMDVSASVLKSRKGSPEGIVYTALDITLHKLREEALKQSEERLRLLVEGVKDRAIFMLDTEGRVVSWNPGAERIHGYSFKEIVGRHFSCFHVPEDLRDGKPERLLKEAETKGSYDDEGWRQRKDGSRFWASVLITALRDDTDRLRGYAKLTRDMTERRRAEILQRKAEELARSNRELEEFAYVASHDMQEPLRKMASFAQLLSERYKNRIDSKSDKFISYIIDGATRMQSLIDNLLKYSKAGREGESMEPTALENVLAQTLVSLELPIRESGAVVTHDFLPTLWINPVQIGQVLQNLINNALKFHGPHPPRIHIGAQLQNNGEWALSVRDNGIGIELQYIPQIFRMFRRLHSRAEYPGTGLGLAICKKIIERHGGKIWVESRPEEGSTFTFTLPDGERRNDEAGDSARRG